MKSISFFWRTGGIANLLDDRVKQKKVGTAHPTFCFFDVDLDAACALENGAVNAAPLKFADLVRG